MTCGDRTQHPVTADTRKDDLDDGAVEELLFGWFEGSSHASWNDEEGWGERDRETGQRKSERGKALIRLKVIQEEEAPEQDRDKEKCK